MALGDIWKQREEFLYVVFWRGVEVRAPAPSCTAALPYRMDRGEVDISGMHENVFCCQNPAHLSMSHSGHANTWRYSAVQSPVQNMYFIKMIDELNSILPQNSGQPSTEATIRSLPSGSRGCHLCVDSRTAVMITSLIRTENPRCLINNPWHSLIGNVIGIRSGLQPIAHCRTSVVQCPAS